MRMAEMQFPDCVRWESFMLEFNKVCETNYGIYGKIYLHHYTNQTLFWINMAENRIVRNRLYQISDERVKRIVEYVKNSIPGRGNCRI
jgi:hypothetical protein